MLNVKVKKLHESAVIPSYARLGDAGLDLTSTSLTTTDTNYVYGTGLAFEIPEGYVGLLFPRSSIYKTDLIMTNSVGVIDSGYRGEVKIIFSRLGEQPGVYQIGERIAQLLILPYPAISLVPVGELSKTARGATGFGSSGRGALETDRILRALGGL